MLSYAYMIKIRENPDAFNGVYYVQTMQLILEI